MANRWHQAKKDAIHNECCAYLEVHGYATYDTHVIKGGCDAIVGWKYMVKSTTGLPVGALPTRDEHYPAGNLLMEFKNPKAPRRRSQKAQDFWDSWPGPKATVTSKEAALAAVDAVSGWTR